MSFRIALLTSAVWFVIATIIFFTHGGNREWIVAFTNNFLRQQNDNGLTTTGTKFEHYQPHWAYKLQFMPRPEQINQEDRICFVHVGKTAGSTVACYLGFDYDHCANGSNDTYSITIPRTKDIPKAYEILQQMIPPGHLAKYTTSTIHKDIDSCSEDSATERFLFVVRNPLERIQSWFEYERISPDDTDIINSDPQSTYMRLKPLFIDCKYQTLNQLGGPKGLGNYNNSLCSRRAYRAITGKIGYKVHNKYNYEYYYKKVYNDITTTNHPRIMILRTEHLTEDWISIENRLYKTTGNQPPIFDTNFTFPHKNKSPKRYEDLFINDTSKANICTALCKEIQYYKKILQAADNLNKYDYATSMHELAQDCPDQVQSTNCDTEIWQ